MEQENQITEVMSAGQINLEQQQEQSVPIKESVITNQVVEKYQATTDDIALLKRQIAVDDAAATELLNKFGGNFVMAIMD